MLSTIGYAIAGAFLCENMFCDKPSEASKEDNESEATQVGEVSKASESVARSDEASKAASTVIYHIKSGEGEVSLPPCRLMAVELGPSADPNKATLQIVINKSVETECSPVTDIEREKKYVKQTPTQYQTNIVLKMKKKGKVPITAYYST